MMQSHCAKPTCCDFTTNPNSSRQPLTFVVTRTHYWVDVIVGRMDDTLALAGFATQTVLLAIEPGTLA